MQKASNNLIKELKKQKRENCSLLFLDNIKIINDVIKQGLLPKLILVDSESKFVWNDSIEHYLVDHHVIEQLADSKTPQGVVCLIEYIQDIVSKPKGNFLVLDTLQDPGNVGTLIRTATACGFSDVFLLDSVNVNNSKMIRSSVGTIFKTKVHSLSKQEFISYFSDWHLPLLKADMNGENIFTTKFPKQIGIVLGNEGNGVSQEISALCNQTISIPMQNDVESLNVAVSGSIIMYQIIQKQ